MALIAPQPNTKRSLAVLYGAGAVVVLAAAVLVYFLSRSVPAPAAPPAGQQAANPNDVQLRNLRFNIEVLQDARFKALRTFGTIPVTVQKPPYRPNPFTR